MYHSKKYHELRRNGMVRKHLFAIVLNVFCLTMSLAITSISIAGEEEKALLKALEKLKASVETGVSYNKYYELLSDARTELNMYKRNHKEEYSGEGTPQTFFNSYVSLALSKYEQAGISWKNKMEYRNSSYDKFIDDWWKGASENLDKAYDSEKKMVEEVRAAKTKVVPKTKEVKKRNKKGE
jgi:IS1 family transposase